MEGQGDCSVWNAPDFFSGPPPQWSLPFWGALALAQTLPEENRPPQSGLLEIHARVEQVVVFQDDRMHRQEFRQSSFPFSGRTYTSSPSEYNGFPLPEKNLKTHGVLAGQDSVPQGGSQGRAWSIEKHRDRTGGYRFRHHYSCGTWENDVTITECDDPSTHCACAK